MDTTERTVPQIARVKMTPHVTTYWARARVVLGGRVLTAHKNVLKVTSVSDVLRHVSVVIVTGSHVML